MAGSKEPHLRIVSTPQDCRREVEELLTHALVAVDLEGVNLGKTGPISIVQVATVTGHVVLFDVYSTGSPAPEMFNEGRLKELLECRSLLKVMHSCSIDSEALRHQYGVTLANVFDTQIAQMLLDESAGRLLPIKQKLMDTCKLYLDNVADLDDKDKIRAKLRTKEAEYWAKRPLTPEMINYAAADVRVLVPSVFNKQSSLLKEKKLTMEFLMRVQDEIELRLDEKVRERIERKVKSNMLMVLRRMARKYAYGTHLDTVTDEDELAALSRADDSVLDDLPLLRSLKRQMYRRQLADVAEAVETQGEDYEEASQKYGLLYYLAHVHGDPELRAESGPLYSRLEEIQLQQISRKYSLETPIHHVREEDKRLLQFLRERAGSSLHPVVHRLHWMVKEEDVVEKFNLLLRNTSSFKRAFNARSVGFYRFLASSPAVPAELRKQAHYFVYMLEQKGLAPKTGITLPLEDPGCSWKRNPAEELSTLSSGGPFSEEWLKDVCRCTNREEDLLMFGYNCDV